MKVDTTDEELGKLADEEGVSILPTFKFYKEGQEVRAIKWLCRVQAAHLHVHAEIAHVKFIHCACGIRATHVSVRMLTCMRVSRADCAADHGLQEEAVGGGCGQAGKGS